MSGAVLVPVVCAVTNFCIWFYRWLSHCKFARFVFHSEMDLWLFLIGKRRVWTAAGSHRWLVHASVVIRRYHRATGAESVIFKRKPVLSSSDLMVHGNLRFYLLWSASTFYSSGNGERTCVGDVQAMGSQLLADPWPCCTLSVSFPGPDDRTLSFISIRCGWVQNSWVRPTDCCDCRHKWENFQWQSSPVARIESLLRSVIYFCWVKRSLLCPRNNSVYAAKKSNGTVPFSVSFLKKFSFFSFIFFRRNCLVKQIRKMKKIP